MTSTKAIALGALAIFTVWAAALLVSCWLLPDWQTRGQVGDSFGALNALFSGLAFAGLIATILLQSKELALQRKELVLQRREMVASREELANQARVQRALYLATVAQVKVSAAQAEVEAIRMESEGFAPGGRDRHVQMIRAVAERVAAIADQVEQAAGVG